MDNHRSVLCYFGIPSKDEENDLLSNGICSTQPLQIINIYSISSQNGLQSNHASIYSRSDVNQIWIRKNYNDLLRVHAIASCNNTVTHLTSLPFTDLFSTLN
jgi:hypothetical protein